MAKKIAPKEVDLVDEKVNKPKETEMTRWFESIAHQDRSTIIQVNELTAKSAWEQFHIRAKQKNACIYAAVFYDTMISILKFIATKQKNYNNFAIAIGNSVNIGYTNNSDDNNEKQGNFMVFMEYIGINAKLVQSADPVLDASATASNAIAWKNLNIKQNVDYIKQIQESAAEFIRTEHRVNLYSSEQVIPLFCIYMDNIHQLVKLKYIEAEGTGVSQVSLNVLGLFDVYYSYDEETHKEYYEYKPGIDMKLAMKSDSVAASHE